MIEPIPFPIFLMIAALLSCLLVLAVLVILSRAFDVADRLAVRLRKVKFTVFQFEYDAEKDK